MPRLIKSGALLFLSVLLLGGGTWIAGGEKVVAELRRFSPWTVTAVIMAFALNLAVVTQRLSRLLHYFHINIPYKIAFKASLQGHFASLFFISLFGQVAGRQAILRHFGTPPVFIASLTAIERVVLFLVSGAFSLLGAAWLLEKKEITNLISKVSFTQVVFIVILSLIASLWFGRSKFERKLLAGIRSKKSIAQFLRIAIITILAQMLVLGAFVFGAMELAPDIGLMSLLAAAAITSFAASLPISVNGWGVREVSAIFAFGLVGIEPSSALAISILVGLCSTAVVLVAWPYSLRKDEISGGITPVDQRKDRLPIEKTATWGLVTGCAIFIFFQVHISLHGGAINLNLADPFAVLALATVVTHAFYAHELPRWRVPKFNALLLAIGLLLLFAFLNGLKVIGVTQWALAGRLIGWLLILGYLCIGVLVVAYLGSMGIWRLIETMIATVIIIILFHAFMRWLIFSGWLNPDDVPQNFEGFSGNRNAFAFQLLACLVLLFAFSGKNKKRPRVNLHLFHSDSVDFLAVLHGIVFAGLVFTGSRAGILTGLMLVMCVGFSRFVHQRILLKSIVYGLLVWVFFVWLLPWISQLFADETNARFAVQSLVSNETSNLERWETIRRGLAMWLESPWLGAGLGVFIETSTYWFKQPIVIHSTPIWFLAEFGILGTGVLLFVVGWLLFSIKRSGFKYSGNRAAIMLIAIFMVFGLVHEIFYQRIFWMVLGMSLALPFERRSR